MEISTIVVQNEAIESVEISNITRQCDSGVINQAGGRDISVKEIVSDLDVLEFAAVSDVADQNGLNLGDGCNRNCNSNASFIDFLVDDLDFERRVAGQDSG